MGRELVSRSLPHPSGVCVSAVLLPFLLDSLGGAHVDVMDGIVVRDVRSARSSSSFDVVTSAETTTFDFFSSAIWNNFRARGLRCLLARVS